MTDQPKPRGPLSEEDRSLAEQASVQSNRGLVRAWSATALDLDSALRDALAEVERLSKVITDHSAEYETVCEENHRADQLQVYLAQAVKERNEACDLLDQDKELIQKWESIAESLKSQLLAASAENVGLREAAQAVVRDVRAGRAAPITWLETVLSKPPSKPPSELTAALMELVRTAKLIEAMHPELGVDDMEKLSQSIARVQAALGEKV